MKILITGAAGLLGTEIVKYLVGELILTDVVEIDPLKIEVSGAVEKVSFRELDITGYNQVYKILSNIRPDVILHLAAYTDVTKAEQEQDKYCNKCYTINVLGTANIVLAASHIKEEFPDSCFVV